MGFAVWPFLVTAVLCVWLRQADAETCEGPLANLSKTTAVYVTDKRKLYMRMHKELQILLLYINDAGLLHVDTEVFTLKRSIPSKDGSGQWTTFKALRSDTKRSVFRVFCGRNKYKYTEVSFDNGTKIRGRTPYLYSTCSAPCPSMNFKVAVISGAQAEATDITHETVADIHHQFLDSLATACTVLPNTHYFRVSDNGSILTTKFQVPLTYSDKMRKIMWIECNLRDSDEDSMKGLRYMLTLIHLLLPESDECNEACLLQRYQAVLSIIIYLFIFFVIFYITFLGFLRGKICRLCQHYH